MKLILALFALPIVALSQGATNDYLFYQKPASGPLVVRPVTPTVGRLLGWPTSIDSPAAITLGTGLSLSGSTLNATASSAWGDLTGVPENLTSWAAITRASGMDTFVTTPSSANLAATVTNETGSGSLVFSTLPTFVSRITTPEVRASSSSNSLILSNVSGTTALEISGVGVTANINIPISTASTIAHFNNQRNLVSLPLDTYPSLTELSYVKGVTSAIQTQLTATTNASNITSGSLALARIEQAGATSGQAIAWNGTAWAPATISSGATLAANTYTGLQQFSGTTHAGLRLNNLTTAERDAISSPAAGMAIWNTTDGRLQLHNGSNWTSGMVRLSGDTMTGALSVSLSALGTTTTPALSLINSTAAAAGAQQVSPAITLRGNGWKTTATAASQTVDFIQDVLPVQGTTAPTGTWRLRTSINGGTPANVMEVDSVGAIYLPNGAAGATGKVMQLSSSVIDIGFGTTTRATGVFIVGPIYPGNSSSAGSFQSDGAGNIAQRGHYDSTLAQSYRLYDTYTSSTDYHRLATATVRISQTATAGATITLTGLIPDGAVVLGVTTKVTTALTGGVTGYQVGTGADPDRWGVAATATLGTTTDNRDWTNGTIECFTAATDIILTANGANFSGTGVIYVSVQYMIGQAD